MDSDDPRRPLLGRPSNRLRRTASRLCGLESWKRRLPITIWLPKYKVEYLFRDAIAGITVGLTSIPQGIAYAMVAGLPPQVGLYSSIFPGFIYALFGSCKDVTVGPTAIIAALIAKYVAYSEDFAYLATFLSGCFILILGIMQLGFLLDFISKPVISAFTTAAAFQIGASQLKSLFRISGKSGGTFVNAVTNFFRNIRTIHLWDSLLGVLVIIALLLIKNVKVSTTSESSGRRVAVSTAVQYLVRARNAILVFGATLLAYLLYVYGYTPFALTGKIHGGLPHFGLPPFSTKVNNVTLDFEDMLSVFGPEGFVLPLVAVLESIAIAKAFAGAQVDATQEMIAVGACNVVAACGGAMPGAGSFTRTALNHACHVATPAGGLFKAGLVLLSVTLLTKAFYFIPKTALAGVIIVAMMSIVDFGFVVKLWKNSKLETCVYVATLVTGAGAGLEYGIALGAAADVLRALAAAARPTLPAANCKIGNQDCLTITLPGALSYSSAAYVARKVRQHAAGTGAVMVLDARQLRAVDIGVAENLISVIVDLEEEHKFLLWNFSESLQKLFEDLHPGFSSRFVNGPSIDQHVLCLSVRSEPRTHILTAL